MEGAPAGPTQARAFCRDVPGLLRRSGRVPESKVTGQLLVSTVARRFGSQRRISARGGAFQSSTATRPTGSTLSSSYATEVADFGCAGSASSM